MDYSSYTIEDFIQDESFVKWALNPNNDNLSKWEKIRALYPEKEDDINIAVDIVISLMNDVNEHEINEDFKKIWMNLSPVVRGEAPYQKKSVEHESQHKLGFWFKVAASIVLVAGFSFWYLQSIEDAPIVSGKIEVIEKSNPKGRRSTITLKDGSKVVLNSESKLSYSSNYGDSTREITLEGEAFFEVTKNAEIPFVVVGGSVTIITLGTSFNVSNFPEDEDVTVSLVTGKVKVMENNPAEKSGNKSYILEPNDQIKFLKGAKTFERMQYDGDGEYLWKEGIISFSQANLPDIVRELERWYGVNIDIGNGSNSMVRYDGIFNNQSLENVLKAMSFSLNFGFTIEDKDIKIVFN